MPRYAAEFEQKGEIDKFYDEVYCFLSTLFKSHIQRVLKIDDIKEAIALSEENISKGKKFLKPN